MWVMIIIAWFWWSLIVQVFHELGLVISARNGDSALFQSVSLTHYNLDFKGTRGSLVFHTDKASSKLNIQFLVMLIYHE